MACERGTPTSNVVDPEEEEEEDDDDEPGCEHDVDLQEDDPYEYDDDIRLPATSGERRDVDSYDDDDDDNDDDADDEERLSLFEAASYLVAGGSSVSTTKVSAPCCKSCSIEGLPLFLLGSPVDASCTCTSRQ